MSSSTKVNLKIGKLQVETLEDTNRKNKLWKSHIIPNHPSRVVFSGASRSGKTNLLINLLIAPEFLLGYYDHIYVVSPSCDSDPSWDAFRSAYDPSEYTMMDAVDTEELSELVVQHKADNSSRILFVLDDCITEENVQKPLLQLFLRGRHINASVWVVTQSYMKVHRNVRMQATNLYIFDPSPGEADRIIDEQLVSGVSKPKLKGIIQKATCTPANHDFFQVNKQGPRRNIYRQNLDVVYPI
jgi:hypothetical protein